MSVLSKYFSKSLELATCRDFVHPDHESCWTSALYYWTVPLPTLAKFFLPLLIIPPVVNYKRLDRKLIREILQDYGSAVFGVFIVGTSSMCAVCLLYNLFGGFMRYTIVGVPTFLGTLNVFVINDKMGRLFARSKFSIIVEILIRAGNNFFTKALRNSVAFRTVAFMSLSACLLDTLTLVSADVFWFIKPLKDPKLMASDDDTQGSGNNNNNNNKKELKNTKYIFSNKCYHQHECQKYNFDEWKNIMKIGLTIGVVQAIISNFKAIAKHPLELFTSINYKLITFIVGYPTIYRLTSCLLTRRLGPDNRLTNITSGFLAGIPFYMYPELSLFGHTVTCVVETLWARYLTSDIRKPRWIETISKWPLSKCFICFGLGYLFHIRAYYPHLAPKLLVEILSYCTETKADQFAESLTSFRMGLHWKNVKDYAHRL